LSFRPTAATLTVLSLLLLVPASPGASAEEDGDSCVDCHSNPNFLVTDRKLYSYFREWESSIHKQEGVSCSDCHGREPSVADKQGSREGDVSASRKRSAVNFKNIPDTCGECHEDIYEGYRKSPHFEHLVAKKEEAQGPNCVTCHGSINAAALNVNTVRESCLRCHNEESENHPEIPDEAKLLLNKFLSIHRYYRYISIRGNADDNIRFFKNLDPQLRDLSVKWHTFELDTIKERTWNVLTLMQEKRKQVRKTQLEERGE
jgi:hypothetical protein